MSRPQWKAALVTGQYDQGGQKKDRTIYAGAGWDGAGGRCINIVLDALPIPVDGKVRITLWQDDGTGGPRGGGAPEDQIPF